MLASTAPHYRSGSRRLPVGSAWATGLTVLALSTLSSGSLASNPSFTTVCFYNNIAAAMAVADFNNDGRPDVAISPGTQSQTTSFFVSEMVNVYLGNGDGTVSGPTQLDAGGGYLYLAAGDLNNDGNVDLVASTLPLAVFMGRGDGTFQRAKRYGGGNTIGIALGDVNGDGFLDIVTTSTNSKSVAVLLNKGNGTFKDKVTFHTEFETWAVTTGDLNADGILDIAALNFGFAAESNGLSVLLGSGNGKFQPHLYMSLPFFAGRELIARDFDGDGKLDLVVPVQGSHGVLTLRGQGDGTFDPPVNYPMTGNTIRAAVGDIDGDGKLDIVAGNYRVFPNGTITILYGDGAGGFVSGDPIAVGFGMGVAAADINGDGRTDVVADGCVLLNDGSAAAVATARLAPTRQPGEPGATLAGVSPNPMQGDGLLSFTVQRAGRVSVRLFDVSGRLVRTLEEGRWAEPGRQELRIMRQGLPGGIYLYRIDSAGGAISGRVVMN